MATRHQARTAVVGLLYAYDLGNENISKYSDMILEADKIRNKQREFSNRLFKGTIDNLLTIDAEIQKHLKGWNYQSIGKVEKAIMRLASFEIMIEGTDKRIIINEAIELSKSLADDKSPRFINAVLDAIGKEESANIEKPKEREVPKEKPE
ncbi:Transcription termination protein NusB [hydrothermal vent metagenome]|uniref:Transcription termination protein NusB n=1 Tax=hydrothermal vent metagenome TaxID=652676 RepID=A0A1W1C6V0_9ZZZZ